MSKPLPHEIIEATRLTRAGRLGEATALLQKMLGAAWPNDAGSPTAKILAPVIDLKARDVTRPDGDAPADKRASDTTDQTPREAAHVPPGARGIFNRFIPAGLAQALHRTLKRSPPAPTEVVPNVGDFVSRSFSNEAGRREYKLYIPSRSGDGPLPLIIMLHGCTQSPDDFAAGTRMNFAAEERACFVAYPEQTRAANSSKCWNWFNSEDQKRGRGEPSLIAGITRQIVADYNIDPRRVYIAGLSAGGAAAAIVAEAYPELYAAVGVHSGLACGVARDLPSAFAAMQGRHPAPASPSFGQHGEARQMPTIVFHGDRDATVHPRNGTEIGARAGAGRKFRTTIDHGSVPAGHTYTRSVHRDAGGHGVIEEWTVHGADHAWSGGNPVGSFTDPRGPDATKEILRFFLEHQLPA